MKQPIQVFVRRAGAASPLELVINQTGYPEIYILTMGQAKNLMLDLTKMLNGSTISPTQSGRSGKKSAGK